MREYGKLNRKAEFTTFSVLGFRMPACAGMTSEVGAGLKPAPTAGLVLVKRILIQSVALSVTFHQALSKNRD